MSSSRITADQKIKNHIFIFNGIINSVVNGQGKCLDLLIFDLIKAFNALWVADSMNDLWDTLPPQQRDDRLGLVFESSRTNLVAINTSVGQTERVNIPEIAQQGGTWGPMMCSNSIDKIGKSAKITNSGCIYKNSVNIVPLAIVDDLLAPLPYGFKSIEMNTAINTMVELKKFQFYIPEKGKKSIQCI